MLSLSTTTKFSSRGSLQNCSRSWHAHPPSSLYHIRMSTPYLERRGLPARMHTYTPAAHGPLRTQYSTRSCDRAWRAIRPLAGIFLSGLLVPYSGHTLRFSDGPYECNFLCLPTRAEQQRRVVQRVAIALGQAWPSTGRRLIQTPREVHFIRTVTDKIC